MLATGTRLGPYEIVAPLGAGGMGEVYRARDTRLSRDVAVKVLPQHLSREPEVRARFEREARAISSLNHPHICVLHDVGREGETDYLVMELVEGETLSKRLARGPLPLVEVLRLGSQVAEALSRAHRAGVVHRDLKPGNIMVTKTGAKLMDFGLARTARSAPHAEELTQALTETSPITGEGRILGTVPYMAPEQFEGREADARSDIWALGCVLYEMATGTRAFGGSSTASVMSAILRDEPAPLAERAPASPPALERLIRSCLAKDANDRWQSAGDLARELGWIVGGGEGSVARAGRDARMWIAAALVVALAGFGGAWLAGRTSLGERHPRRAWASLDLPVRGLGQAQYALSPDGSKVALLLPDSSGLFRLFVRPISSPDLLPLVPDETVQSPFWSPDSREIGFLNGEGKLERVIAAGGPPQVICKAGPVTLASWSRSGWIVYGFESGAPLMKVPASGGTPVPATALDSSRQEIGHANPEFLPDGRHFLFSVLPSVSPNHFSVRVGSLDGTSSHALLVVQSIPQSDGRGHIVFMRDRALYSQGIDDRGDRLLGNPVPLEEAPARQVWYDGYPVARVAGERLVYLPDNKRPTDFVWFRRDGVRLDRVAQMNGMFTCPALSPDGRRLVALWTQGREVSIWLLDLATGSQRRLTGTEDWNSFAIWASSGRQIAYATERSGNYECRLMDPDAPESTRVIATGGVAVCLAPGNRQVVLVRDAVAGQPSSSSDLVVHDLDGATSDRGYAASSANETDCVLFDGGRRAAFVSDASGRWEIYCDNFPVRRNTVQLTHEGCAPSSPGGRGYWVVGKELIYVSSDRKTLRSVMLRQDGDDIHPGEARTLCDLPPERRGFMPSPDGQRFLFALPAGASRLASLTFVDHWNAPPASR